MLTLGTIIFIVILLSITIGLTVYFVKFYDPKKEKDDDGKLYNYEQTYFGGEENKQCYQDKFREIEKICREEYYGNPDRLVWDKIDNDTVKKLNENCSVSPENSQAYPVAWYNYCINGLEETDNSYKGILGDADESSKLDTAISICKEKLFKKCNDEEKCLEFKISNCSKGGIGGIWDGLTGDDISKKEGTKKMCKNCYTIASDVCDKLGEKYTECRLEELDELD